MLFKFRMSLAAAVAGALLEACGGGSGDSQGAITAGEIRKSVDVTKLSIAELQEGYQTREYTTEEVVKAYLAQIDTRWATSLMR